MIPPDGAARFLADHGWNDCDILPLAGDASFRRYFRIVDRREDRQAVLMDAPPPHEDPRPFVRMAEWLAEVGLTAPRVLAQDLGQGLLLLNDLGDARLRETLDDDPDSEEAMYETAVDVLVHLHDQPPLAELPVHGLEQWMEEVGLFLDWYVPAVGLQSVDRAGWDAAWNAVLSPVADDGLAPVTVLRDYHAENIMLVDGKDGVHRFGLLDFQDALSGHPAYDLVSVLEDARRDVDPAIETKMIERYRTVTSADQRFDDAYWALAAQRNTRILGVFCRLWKRDGKERYKSFQLRMWGLLERDLSHPSLAPVKNWFDANVPADKRSAFWQGASE
ncbi:phosphotransferase [Sphingomonas sp. LY29]|uniref:aminoglycoside phosphotransferase family protein n=1 Tax=Sphingomonas sp. LY29 TaxID=3095341 RepID=UPI002D78801E|nr:phosphotransferase [Sphingomonas sp. LY29]WRP27009.1 phosphotransferase [Sphingomonas sp. LY29]